MSKLGTKENPAIVRVKTEQKALEIYKLCQSRGWQVIVGIEANNTVDISDVENLLYPPQPLISKRVERNEPCPCGSGQKAKKCCYA